jgi:hypothetical protein
MSVKKKIEWWPIGIIAAMLTFMGGVLFAVSIMVRNDVPLTSDDYYAQEIAYQDVIDKSARGLTPENKPELRTMESTGGLEIVFPGHKRGSAFTGKATFFRPSDPKKDFAVELAPDSTGMQQIDLQGRDAGLWVLQLEWSQDQTPFYFEQQIMR